MREKNSGAVQLTQELEGPYEETEKKVIGQLKGSKVESDYVVVEAEHKKAQQVEAEREQARQDAIAELETAMKTTDEVRKLQAKVRALEVLRDIGEGQPDDEQALATLRADLADAEAHAATQRAKTARAPKGGKKMYKPATKTEAEPAEREAFQIKPRETRPAAQVEAQPQAQESTEENGDELWQNWRNYLLEQRLMTADGRVTDIAQVKTLGLNQAQIEYIASLGHESSPAAEVDSRQTETARLTEENRQMQAQIETLKGLVQGAKSRGDQTAAAENSRLIQDLKRKIASNQQAMKQAEAA